MSAAGWDQSMCKLGCLTAIAMFVAASGHAFAQAGTEGPLAAPDDPPHAVVKTAKKPKQHKKVAHHEAKRAEESTAAGSAPPRRDIALPGVDTPADPVSFGMKWNGSSDNARETRIQNYNATAPGSGAEVGMKLHF